MGGGRAQCILCSIHLHPPCQGLPAFPLPCNPWVLYGTIGLLMGAGYPENPREADHVPQGAAAPGPCSGSMVWEQGYDGGGMWGMVWGGW